MKRIHPWRAVGLVGWLAAGFGASLLWHPVGSRKDPRAKIPATETSATPPPSRSRPLHLEHLWSQRRARPVAAEMSRRVIVAASSGIWDEASKKEAVSLLIADPSFINTIRNAIDPGKRDAMLSQLIKALVNDSPPIVLDVLDAGTFDFSTVPEIGNLLAQTIQGAPVLVFEAVKRNRGKLSKHAFDDVITSCGYHVESARMILEDAVLGAAYPDRALDNAIVQVMYNDGALPPGVAGLEAAAKIVAKREAQDSISQWLKGTKELTAEQLRTMDDKGVFQGMFYTIWHWGKEPRAEQLELLAAAGRTDEQQRALELMIEGGRTKEALRLLDELKDMPATKPGRDELISALATSVYEAGGDVGEACRLMAGIGDDPVYWKSMKDVLTNWVIDDPLAGRAYLEQVTDPELRRSLEETLAKTSLDP